MTKFDRKRVNKIKQSVQIQQDEMDCGAACLSTIIQYYDGAVSMAILREQSGTSKDGATFLGLQHAANYFGLQGEGYESDVESLTQLEGPCILHIRIEALANHYVVCFGYIDEKFHLVDPASGYVTMTKSQLQEKWVSQKLLLVECTEKFRKKSTLLAEQRKWVIDILLKNRQSLVLIALMGLVVTILNLTTAIFTQKLVDEIFPRKELPFLLTTLFFWALVLTITVALNFLRNTLLARQSFEFNVAMLRDFFRIFLKQPKSFFDSKRVGDIIVRLNDAEKIESTIREIVSNTMIDGMMLIAGLVVAYLYSGTVALIIVILVPLYFVLGYLGNGDLIHSYTKMMRWNSQIESEYINTIHFAEEIKIAQKEDYFFRRVTTLYAAYQNSILDLKTLSIKFGASVKLLSTFMLVAITISGALQVFSNELLLGELFALFAIATIIAESATSLSLLNIKFQGARVAIGRMFEFSQAQPKTEIPRHQGEIDFVELTLDKVSFRFIGRPLLLKDVSLHLGKGDIVSVFGKSGEGKSTLLQLIQKFYTVENGGIFVNGMNLRDIPDANWARVVALVPQKVNLIRGTVIENICLDEISDKKENDVMVFCEQHGFDAYFNNFPYGYDTYLGEDGTKISGGELQLIALARALYLRPQLLLLDEPTSAMDIKTEDFVLKLLKELKSTMGILLVTHKIRTSQISDRVCVLSDGVVSDFGTPMELLSFDNFYSASHKGLMVE